MGPCKIQKRENGALKKYKISIDKFKGRARSCQGPELTFLVRPILGSVVFAFHEGEPSTEREILLFALQSGLLKEYEYKLVYHPNHLELEYFTLSLEVAT
jgi:hypothetical protein